MPCLSPRQQRFISEYSVDRNGAAAARRAGYSARSAKVAASRLLTNANVQAALGAAERQVTEELDLSRRRVMAGLQDAIGLARLQGDAGAMIGGWRELARMCGFYEPEHHRVTVTRDGQAVLNRLDSMTDAELLALTGPAGVTEVTDLDPFNPK